MQKPFFIGNEKIAVTKMELSNLFLHEFCCSFFSATTYRPCVEINHGYCHTQIERESFQNTQMIMVLVSVNYKFVPNFLSSLEKSILWKEDAAVIFTRRTGHFIQATDKKMERRPDQSSSKRSPLTPSLKSWQKIRTQFFEDSDVTAPETSCPLNNQTYKISQKI